MNRFGKVEKPPCGINCYRAF